MNRIEMTVMVTVLATLNLAGCAEEKIPMSLQNPMYLDVSQVLEIYRQLSGKTIEVPREVREDNVGIVIRQTKPMTRAEARKLIEDDLRDQAGIVIVYQDRKHVEFGLEANEKIEP
jgi:hypothetical protein